MIDRPLQDGATLEFAWADQRLRLLFLAPSIVRVTCTQGRAFTGHASAIVNGDTRFAGFEVEQQAEAFFVTTPALRLRIDRRTSAIEYCTVDGRPLLREPAEGGRHLTPRVVTRNIFERDETFAESLSIDGARAEARIAGIEFVRDAFEARLDFVFADDEALFGLGSHEEGYGNLRGHSRELYQQNMKAVVPTLVSTRGWAILLDCTSLMEFHDDALGSYWWADCVDELDFYFVAGGDYDAVSAGLRQLTGAVPLPPKWMFGYVQSKERYVHQKELLDVVREYRRRKIPLDTIVLDWKSWPNGAGWGQKSFDPLRFPDPSAMMADLHALGARLMVSIWPIMTGGCADQRELIAADAMLGNQSTYDAFSPRGREIYFQQAARGLLAHGIDAWWCDCTEPFEADWSGAVKPEPQARLLLNTRESKRYLDPGRINGYSLAHSQGIYEGQRAASSKRVVNLTRSSYAGQSRYATVTWNGDVCATWETLRRCIPEGLNFVATGEPYWTTDIGGFFIANDPALWFWRGDYNAGTRGLTAADALEPDPRDSGCTDLGFQELYTRWLQYATFLPMMRSHGTDAAREIWRFAEPFYSAIAASIRLRYRILPYLYSLAAQVTRCGQAMLRALALAYPQDPRTYSVTDQFLLGPSLLVCPVTAPMLYGPNSTPLHVEQGRPVYLPNGHSWHDFHTGQVHAGGQQIVAAAPVDRIPLFVQAGSLLPLALPMQFTDEHPEAPYELHLYAGADCIFALYEDAGDTYDYERGACALIEIAWEDAAGKLTLAERQGTFPELRRDRTFQVMLHAGDIQKQTTLYYTGAQLAAPALDSEAWVAMPGSGSTGIACAL